MSSIFWSVGILAVTIAGILGLRTLSRRIRFLFDIVCLAALSMVLYQHGATPFSQAAGASAGSFTIWLQVITVAWWLLSARAIVSVMYFTLRHDRRSREAKLFVDLVAAAIYISTVLIVLKSVLALPIGGLLATSSVVAIVLGLALQSTLADVFSGIAVGIEEPFQVGDRISLGSDIEGQVVEMNWRSIRVQTDGADLAIIPNSVMAKLQIVNRSVPSRLRSVSVQLWCPATADPDRVIDVLQQAIMLCPSLLETPPPSVALTRAGPRWCSYTVAFSVPDTNLVTATKSLLLRHARKQLHYAGLLDYRPKRSSQPSGGRTRFGIFPARQILGELALFDCLQAAQLEDLALRVGTRLLEPDDLLFSQGAADATLYVVASGILEVTQETDAAGKVTLGCLGAGEYLGEIGLLTGAAHAATARARTHCCVYQLSREAIAPLLTANAEMAAAFDKSARRGLDLLHRSVAVRATENMGAGSQLLERIRAFFHSRPS